jgi:hypothetical protein
MRSFAALPFMLDRTQDEINGNEITSTREKVHGLLRLDGDQLRIQWRVARSTDRFGVRGIRTDRELEPVREVALPIRAIAGARVRWRWWEWPVGPRLLLVGADLRAFEQIAGATGLRLEHPAELALRVRHNDRLAAREFAGELALVVADHALQAAEQLPSRPDANPTMAHPPDALPAAE